MGRSPTVRRSATSAAQALCMEHLNRLWMFGRLAHAVCGHRTTVPKTGLGMSRCKHVQNSGRYHGRVGTQLIIVLSDWPPANVSHVSWRLPTEDTMQLCRLLHPTTDRPVQAARQRRAFQLLRSCSVKPAQLLPTVELIHTKCDPFTTAASKYRKGVALREFGYIVAANHRWYAGHPSCA